MADILNVENEQEAVLVPSTEMLQYDGDVYLVGDSLSSSWSNGTVTLSLE